MATDANDVSSGTNSGGRGGHAPARTTIALRIRVNRIFVDVQSVHGCTEIERLSRIPGAPKSVTGLILFMGEAVPLIDLFGGSTVCSTPGGLTQRRKADEYVVIFSIRGIRFAVRVDEPPQMCTDMSAFEIAGGNVCHMRTRHLERLFDLRLARVKNMAPAESDSRTGNNPEAKSDSHGIEQTEQTAAKSITDLCCAT
ncbi:MAG: chemotaxis protein CheW [Candidatus Eisenbacteria bacterium]|nr:chemotaxis protein CheW [Candidatus Eisenbacteria bacterium]